MGDVLTDDGATGTAGTRFQITVTAVDSNGAIIDADVTTAGSYTVLPTEPIGLDYGGAGFGATCSVYFAILTVTVTGGGTLYTEHALPVITASGSGGQKYQNPILLPVMTATQGQLQLNNGKINVTGIPTSSAGLSAGDIYSNAGVLTVV